MKDFLRTCIEPVKEGITGVLHIGAHTGQEAPLYDELGIKNVVWVEANPELIPRLQANVEPYGHRIIECAVSDTRTFGKLHVTNNDGHSSSLLLLGEHRKVWPNIFSDRYIEVPTNTLDAIYGQHDLWGCNLWVIDIQGGEVRALRGAKRSLSCADYVLAEVNLCRMYMGCGLADEVDDMLYDFTVTNTYVTSRHGYGESFYRRIRCTTIDLVRRGAKEL